MCVLPVVRPHFGTNGMTSKRRPGGYKRHGIDLERRLPWTSTTTVNPPSCTKKSTMTRGAKRSGSPLEGGSTKLFIIGPANDRTPLPRVAHLQELTGATEAPDFHCEAHTLAEGTFTRLLFSPPNDMFRSYRHIDGQCRFRNASGLQGR